MLRRKAFDRRQQRIPVIGRWLHGKTAVAEGHHADHHPGGLVLDKILRGNLGSFHARRLEVGGCHAA